MALTRSMPLMDRGGINLDHLRITISLGLLVLSRKLFSEAHDEMCANSAETVDRADAGTIKYVSFRILDDGVGLVEGMWVGNHHVEE